MGPPIVEVGLGKGGFRSLSRGKALDGSLDGSDNFSGDVSLVCSVLVGRVLDNTHCSAGSGFQQAEPDLQRTSTLQSRNGHCGRDCGTWDFVQMPVTVPSSSWRVVSCVMEGHMVRGGLPGLPHVPTCEPSLAAEP